MAQQAPSLQQSVLKIRCWSISLSRGALFVSCRSIVKVSSRNLISSHQDNGCHRTDGTSLPQKEPYSQSCRYSCAVPVVYTLLYWWPCAPLQCSAPFCVCVRTYEPIPFPDGAVAATSCVCTVRSQCCGCQSNTVFLYLSPCNYYLEPINP